MSDHLYHDALLALAKDTSKSGRLEPNDGSARADNPLCGDRVTIDLAIHAGRITNIAQKTRGCILTQAAAAMIAQRAVGLNPANTAVLRDAAKRFLKGEDGVLEWPELNHFKPVREIASRHDCILIAFKALEDAAQDAQTRG